MHTGFCGIAKDQDSRTHLWQVRSLAAYDPYKVPSQTWATKSPTPTTKNRRESFLVYRRAFHLASAWSRRPLLHNIYVIKLQAIIRLCAIWTAGSSVHQSAMTSSVPAVEGKTRCWEGLEGSTPTPVVATEGSHIVVWATKERMEAASARQALPWYLLPGMVCSNFVMRYMSYHCGLYRYCSIKLHMACSMTLVLAGQGYASRHRLQNGWNFRFSPTFSRKVCEIRTHIKLISLLSFVKALNFMGICKEIGICSLNCKFRKIEF